MFSHQRSSLPSVHLCVASLSCQRTEELETYKVVTLGVRYPYRAGLQDAGSLRPKGRGWGGRAGDLQQYPRRERQGTTYDYQGAACRYIHRGGKLQEILPVIATRTDEYRYGKR